MANVRAEVIRFASNATDSGLANTSEVRIFSDRMQWTLSRKAWVARTRWVGSDPEAWGGFCRTGEEPRSALANDMFHGDIWVQTVARYSVAM